MADETEGKRAGKKRKDATLAPTIDLTAVEITPPAEQDAAGSEAVSGIEGEKSDTASPVETVPYPVVEPAPIETETAMTATEATTAAVPEAEPAAKVETPPVVETVPAVEAAPVEPVAPVTPPAEPVAGKVSPDLFESPPPSGSSYGGMMAAGLTGGLVGAALMAALSAGGVFNRAQAPAPDNDATQRIAEMAQEIASLRETASAATNRLALVETAARVASDLASKAQSDAAEARQAADAAASAAGEARTLAEARPQVDASGAAPAAAPVDLAPLQDRLAAVEGRMATLPTPDSLADAGKRLGVLEASAGQTKEGHAAAVAISLTTLAAAIEGGRPFVPELRAASAIVSDDDKLAPLAEFAEAGAPTAASLARGFDKVAPRLLEALAKQETGSSGDADIFARLLNSASRVVIIRKVGEEAQDSAAPVNRTLEALRRGDVPAAIEAFDALPETIRALAPEWRRDAKSAVTAADAVARLRTDALAALGG